MHALGSLLVDASHQLQQQSLLDYFVTVHRWRDAFD